MAWLSGTWLKLTLLYIWLGLSRWCPRQAPTSAQDMQVCLYSSIYVFPISGWGSGDGTMEFIYTSRKLWWRICCSSFHHNTCYDTFALVAEWQLSRSFDGCKSLFSTACSNQCIWIFPSSLLPNPHELLWQYACSRGSRYGQWWWIGIGAVCVSARGKGMQVKQVSFLPSVQLQGGEEMQLAQVFFSSVRSLCLSTV